MKRMTRSLAVLLAVAMLASAGCGTFTQKDALIASGETLKAADKEYRVVAAAYVESCKQTPRRPSDVECTAFRDFGQKWNAGFPLAADLWLAAKDSGDKATLDGAAAAISSLLVELSKWALKMLAMVAPAGGK